MAADSSAASNISQVVFAKARQLGGLVTKEAEEALSLIRTMLDERKDLTDTQKSLMIQKVLTEGTYDLLVKELSLLSEDTKQIIKHARKR